MADIILTINLTTKQLNINGIPIDLNNNVVPVIENNIVTLDDLSKNGLLLENITNKTLEHNVKLQ